MPVMDVFGWLLDQASLPTYLGGDLIVRQTSGGEDGDLLPSGNGVHGINGRNTRSNHFFWIDLALMSGCLLLNYVEHILESRDLSDYR